MMTQTDFAELQQALQDVGLSEKAAGIYLSLLGKNRLGIADLARETGLKRATCYEHVAALLAQDFIMRVPIGKRTLYAAQDPEKVLQAVQLKTAIFASKVKELSAIHAQTTNKPRVTFHEGKRELRAIYEDLFKTMGDTYSIFPAEAFFKNFSDEEYNNLDKQNSAHAMKTHDLFIADPKLFKKLNALREKNEGFEHKHAKRLPDWFTSNVDMLLFKDKVALISLRDLTAVVIENQDIAELLKNMHTFIWKGV